MHTHVSTRRGHAHARTGRTGLQAWLSGAHTRTCRQLLASARAPQSSHINRTRTRLPAHTFLAGAGRHSDALNFPTVKPRAEPRAAPGRGPRGDPCLGPPLCPGSCWSWGRWLPALGPELAPRGRHRHLAVRATLGGAARLARSQASWILEKRDSESFGQDVCGRRRGSERRLGRGDTAFRPVCSWKLPQAGPARD